MLIQYILIPVFILVLRTFVLLYAGRGRGVDARGDGLLVDPFDVLFYVLVAYLIPTRHADWIMVMLACAYAVLRIVQAGFDLRGGTAAWSRPAGEAARVVLLVMWIWFAGQIFAGI